VVDLPRRAQVSQAANTRYLEALAEADSPTPLGQVADVVRQPVLRGKRRYRGLAPLSGPDAQLAEILLRGEFLLHGFRNRDLYCKQSSFARRAQIFGCGHRPLQALRASVFHSRHGSIG
jgi:hypothetical protein